MSSKLNFTLSDEYLELLSDLKCEVLNDTVANIAEAYYGFDSAKRSIFEVRLMQAMCFVGLSSANIAKFLPDCEEANEYVKVLADIPASSEKRRSRVSSANFRAHASIFVYIFAYLAAAIREDRMTYDDLDNLCPNCLLVLLKKNAVCPCCENDASNATFKEDHGEAIVRFLLSNIGDYYIERAYSAMRDLLKTSGKFIYILSPIAPFVDDLKYVLTTAGMKDRIATYDFVTIDGCVSDTSANAVDARPVISKVKSKSKPKPKRKASSSSTSKPKSKPKRKASSSSTTTTSSSKPKAKKQKRKAPSSSLNTPMTAPLSELPMIMQKPPPPPSSNLIEEWSDEGPSFLSEKKVHEPVMGALAFPIIETDENLFQWVDEHITTNTTNTNIVNYHDFMNSIRPPSF